MNDYTSYIDQATEQFRQLLVEQLARQDKMEAGEEAKDFTKMEKITVGICGGENALKFCLHDRQTLAVIGAVLAKHACLLGNGVHAGSALDYAYVVGGDGILLLRHLKLVYLTDYLGKRGNGVLVSEFGEGMTTLGLGYDLVTV